MNANEREYKHKYALFPSTEAVQLNTQHKSDHKFFLLLNRLRNFSQPKPARLTIFNNLAFDLRSFCVMHMDVRMPQTQEALARRICVFCFFSTQ